MRIPASVIFANVPARVLTFASAVALGSLIALSRLPLQDTLGAKAPFILAWPGMMLAAFLGGFWPTLIVAGVGLAVGQWALSAGGGTPAGPVGAAIFLAFALVFATAGGARKRYLRRAKAHAERLAEVQSQLLQVARLNAVGEMAGSLAHELNQPLTAAANYLNAVEQLLDRDASHRAKAKELVRKASDQVVRAGQIVARVRANVDQGEIETAEESLGSLVQEAVDVATTGKAKEGLVIRYGFDRAIDCVLADRIQVQQVVLNLVRNAIEAMSGQPRRELGVGSRQGEPGFLDVFVADTGPGIAPEMVERLFEPFASGKPGGMGIGLSISRNIVEAHGGRMWAQANVDGGATFSFSLKRAGAGAHLLDDRPHDRTHA